MYVYFNSRDKARKAIFGKLVDFGPSAPAGKRYARRISGSGGNAKQRRVALRAALREM